MTENLLYTGAWDFLALNHYTTFFTYESEEGVSIIPDSDVCMMQDDNYSIGASFWLQVNLLHLPWGSIWHTHNPIIASNIKKGKNI
jgi:hypothetical protein